MSKESREFKIKDFELGGTKVVSAQGVTEAMIEYLPWQVLDVKIASLTDGEYSVIDNTTDFKYEVSTDD